MSNYIQEQYRPVVIGVTTTVVNPSNGIGGFIAITAGTLTIKKNNANQDIIINALPVSAGVYYPLPFHISNEGIIAITAGGASGVLGVH